jgi:hypothetical protein
VYSSIPRRTDPQVVFAAEQVLSTVVGSQIQFTRVERLSEGGRRNLLLRCYLPSSSNLPSSLIIKKVEASSYHPEDPNSWDTIRFSNDWMGSQFLSALPSQFKHSPHFYGGDRAVGLIILEDVQHHARLVESLLGRDRTQAERALWQYSTCLGQLHADTIGKAAKFEELFQTIASQVKPIRETVNIHLHQLILERLGVYPDRNWLRDLEAIEEAMNDPGDFLAYIHTDACPDNVLDTGEVLRLIDFETGRFGHALIDAAYGRMMFPSCWCANRLPHATVQQMEDTYRLILSHQCLAAQDDRIFESALVKSCGFWLLYTLARHLESALKKDSNWGIATTRQRILARLEAFIITSQEFNHLAGLRGTSNQLLDLLRQRWSGVPPLPYYPALAS